MKLTIEQTNNGFILSWEEEVIVNESALSTIDFSINPKETHTEKEVIEGDESDGGDKEAIERLLYRVAEFFGIQYEKYGENNLNISWNKKGHKLE